MGELLPYRTPKTRSDTTGVIGMVIFLASWAMMFAALFFSYAYVRSNSSQWPPDDVPVLPVGLPAVNTVVLAVSSAVLQLGLFQARRGRMKSLAPAMLAAAVLGMVFLGLQWQLWSSLTAQGLTPTSGGSYGSVFYGLTWLHALHVVVGLLGLGWVCRQSFSGAYSVAKHMPARLWGIYWHFVGVIWALMFVTIFLV
jgi:cytochrome c oxidase subunit 3